VMGDGECCDVNRLNSGCDDVRVCWLRLDVKNTYVCNLNGWTHLVN
jgi:hypothetical protein